MNLFCADVILELSVIVTGTSNTPPDCVATLVCTMADVVVPELTVALNLPHVGVVNVVSYSVDLNDPDVNDTDSSTSQYPVHDESLPPSRTFNEMSPPRVNGTEPYSFKNAPQLEP